MRTMTADIRKIRSGDFDAADAPADARETEGRPVVLTRLALPFNDNAREAQARGLAQSQDADSADGESFTRDRPAPTEGLSASPRIRRRGPLVTRWIGFAAERRRAQARVNRMRARRNAGASEPSAH